MIDDERFEAVWAAHGAHVARYCAFAAGSKEAGQDLAAETFAKFLTHGDPVSGDRVEAWLFTVARNLCTSHHRSAGRARRLEAALAEQTAACAGIAEPRDAEGTDPALAEAIRGLGDTERLAVYLRVVEERPYAEVARAVRRSEGATRMLVLRSLRRLKTTLAPMHQTPGALASEGDAQHA
jgi:RNA polymerase sigma-70 factor (ECF subfamily)